MKHTLQLRPRARTSIGQHFLSDPNIARKIASTIDPRPQDAMVEIGPGDGALTALLVPHVRSFVAYEIDRRVIPGLRTQWPSAAIVCGDFLEADVGQLARASGRKIRVVGNIPYNITSPILFRLFDQREAVQDAVLMMQREVARRLVAVPRTKDYGILSVAAGMACDVRIVFDVGPRAFVPPPSVTSSVVHLAMLPSPRHPVASEQFFRSMVRGVFNQRRKTLRNSLGAFLAAYGVKPPAGEYLSRRPEELSLRELVSLSNTIYPLLGSEVDAFAS